MADTTDQKNIPYQFTSSQDWFSFNADVWRSLFKHVMDPEPRALEIGSWEGRSAVFALTELCAHGGELVCIDHFDLMKTDAGRARHRKLVYNLSLTQRPFRIIDEFSVPGLMAVIREEMSAEQPGFDWIYVDGSHEADDTFLDGELVWRLARKGAIIIFDDYHWDKEPEDSVHHPKRGIDTFMTLHSGQYTVLSSPQEYQVVLQKKTEMRIGFLTKEDMGVQPNLSKALGYGIHIALTIDTAYAMAAAVAIRSTITHTNGRVTFYVVHSDLSEDNKDKLRRSASGSRTDATIVFIDLPSPSWNTEDKAANRNSLTWAKVDMIPLLPIERVLYLDADVLIRGNLQELWDLDLGGRPIGAAADVGFPMGHDRVRRKPYFNAGVLLMDLARIREEFADLQALTERMEDSRFRDQDALNSHFEGRWKPFSLEWNAQGLGTYARYSSEARASLDLKDMDDPRIVHFTGPVHPSLVDVLNPHVQPYTAKPWGYAGAPGHPYEVEWWEECEKTCWRGWRSTAECYDLRAAMRKKAVEEAVSAFEEGIGC